MAEKEARLIDANALSYKMAMGSLGEQLIYVSADDIRNAPTIDPESLRPHAKWRLNNDGSGTCGNCHRTTVACWDYDNYLPYCPHCGAKIDTVSSGSSREWMQNWHETEED